MRLGAAEKVGGGNRQVEPSEEKGSRIDAVAATGQERGMSAGRSLITSGLNDQELTVLLIDDQAIIGEAVRRMLAGESDLKLHYLSDPKQALETCRQIQPKLILQDLVMPEVDGLELVRQFREDPATRDVPMIVLSSKEEPKTKAEAFALGANDYLVKLPDKIELIARIRYHAKGYLNLLQRNEAFRQVEASQRALAKELEEASDYVRSLLPPPIEGEIATAWQFISSTSLGGDSFGYHWIDEDHFAVYLLDVCGHGVGAALLSVSAMNVLRSQALPQTDFREPSQVLAALNEAFDMEKQNQMYFTIWYGVFRKTDRNLVFSSGGHPPAILVRDGQARSLRTQGLVIGGLSGAKFKTDISDVPPGSQLYLFSDGVYEITRSDGSMMQLDELVDHLVGIPGSGQSKLEKILARAQEVNCSEQFDDDYSMVEVLFH
ncbi:MAG: SpoIIE family protein phosphatase [Candidatus Methylacidiphilales bacterium]